MSRPIGVGIGSPFRVGNCASGFDAAARSIEMPRNHPANRQCRRVRLWPLPARARSVPRSVRSAWRVSVVSRSMCGTRQSDRAALTTAPDRRRQAGFGSGRSCTQASWCATGSAISRPMLHLRARYVSKAAILGVPGPIAPVKIEVSFEFQGLGSLGAARGDGFSLASLTA